MAGTSTVLDPALVLLRARWSKPVFRETPASTVVTIMLDVCRPGTMSLQKTADDTP